MHGPFIRLGFAQAWRRLTQRAIQRYEKKTVSLTEQAKERKKETDDDYWRGRRILKGKQTVHWNQWGTPTSLSSLSLIIYISILTHTSNPFSFDEGKREKREKKSLTQCDITLMNGYGRWKFFFFLSFSLFFRDPIWMNGESHMVQLGSSFSIKWYIGQLLWCVQCVCVCVFNWV